MDTADFSLFLERCRELADGKKIGNGPHEMLGKKGGSTSKSSWTVPRNFPRGFSESQSFSRAAAAVVLVGLGPGTQGLF